MKATSRHIIKFTPQEIRDMILGALHDEGFETEESVPLIHMEEDGACLVEWVDERDTEEGS